MTTNQNTQTDLESRVKEMEEENELLLLQLHQVQEELEHYYLRNQELEKAQSSVVADGALHTQGWVDDELPDVLGENRRLSALAEVQQKLHRIETENALNARLGNILIEAADNGNLLSVPGKLIKVWRQASRQEPPAVLGGKNFDKVISAYNEGGFDAVERLMTDSAVWPVMQANAYTTLARQLMKTDRRNAAEAARRAHALDPKPYRLKWLAFRLHEAGEIIEAEAMLDLLPAETPFSDSETRQADQLRYEAKHARQREAKQQTGYAERRAAVEKQLRALTQEKDAQAIVAAERGREIEALKQSNAALTKELDVLKQEAAQSREEGEALLRQLHQVQEQWERTLLDKQQLETVYAASTARLDEESQVVADLKAQLAELNDAHQNEKAELRVQIEALQRAHARLEDEKSALVRWHDEAVELAEELSRDIENLKQAQTQYEQQQETLAAQCEELNALAAERQTQLEQLAQSSATTEQKLLAEIETLRQLQARTEQEKSAIVKWHDELVVLADERNRRIEALENAQANFQQLHTALTERHDEQVKHAAELRKKVESMTQMAEKREAEYRQELNALRQQQEKLDQEILALASKAEQAERLAAERLKKIDELQQQIQLGKTGEKELTNRQQLMHEEMVRAEAQLDLIKDMLLREPGL